MRKYTAAVVQLDTQNDKGKNLEYICNSIDQAAEHGASLVCFPEVMNLIGRNVGEGGGTETVPGFTTERLIKKAKERRIYIQAGSITEEAPGDTRFYNTAVLISPEGEILAKYRKLHMFDITLADGTKSNESEKVCPGDQIVTVDTELGKIGLAICYDIRFPELFRIMAAEGAQVIITPSSFTMPTGKDHWEPLLKARAIENACYMIAPSQIGKKPRYVAYGNSMVVDPWGTVIARSKDEPGIVYAEIDLDYLDKVRRQLPSLNHIRGDIYSLTVTL